MLSICPTLFLILLILIIFIHLSGVGLRGQQLKQMAPDFPFPSHIDQGIPRCSQASVEI